MSGPLYAILAGIGFGLFQAFNRRAVLGLDVFVSTFLQLLISLVVMLGVVAAGRHLPQLVAAPGAAWIHFGLAGCSHYFVGWTLLNASQQRIGAARTSPLLSTVPLFATILAALALREIPTATAMLGVVVVVAGVYLVGYDHAGARGGPGAGWRGSIFGLGAALCWAISPVFVRLGLAVLPSPLLGYTIGLITATAAYTVGMLIGARGPRRPLRPDAVVYKLIAGVLVAVSQWARWIAIALAPVGVALALAQVAVPVTILLSPFFVGRQLERVTPRVWAGAAIVVAGSILLVSTR